ncbi:MAG: Esterase, partial [Acidimicrobiales bacterium]|nr:Esterase [Acidimicrobiales bacterium]
MKRIAVSGLAVSFVFTSLLVATSASAAEPSVVGIATTPSGAGHWVVDAAGRITTDGDAVPFGSLAGRSLQQPIVAMAATPTGHGYWLVARDGGIFSFGDAPFKGSTGAIRLNQPIVGMAATPTGHGYWLVARDGGIFTFGDATFLGSAADGADAPTANSPAVGVART